MLLIKVANCESDIFLPDLQNVTKKERKTWENERIHGTIRKLGVNSNAKGYFFAANAIPLAMSTEDKPIGLQKIFVHIWQGNIKLQPWISNIILTYVEKRTGTGWLRLPAFLWFTSSQTVNWWIWLLIISYRASEINVDKNW